MITPVNTHILIDPVPQETFTVSDRNQYEEAGIVIESCVPEVKKGDKVYFDSWLAAKFAKGHGEYYWLVKWQDVRAIEHGEVSE